MDNAEIDQTIRRVLASLGPALKTLDHKSVESFLNFGELALAFETLCDQIAERQATPTQDAYDAMAALAERLSIDARYMQSIPKPVAR